MSIFSIFRNGVASNAPALATLALAFALTISCSSSDDGGNPTGGDPSSSGGGDAVIPTGIDVRKNSGGVTFIDLWGFVCNIANSSLPGFTQELSELYANTSSSGFSISSGGTNIPIANVIINDGYISVTTNTTFSAGQQVTLSYTPNGTHIFKASKVEVSGITWVTLGAFILTGTAQ